MEHLPRPPHWRLGAPLLTRLEAERGSSVVEYVGLGAVATMLVSAVAAAIDSAAGDRLGAAIVHRLLEAIEGFG
jgi:hypothetical protein